MGLFKKQEEILEYPYEYAIVRLTNSAKNNFIDDDFNREIIIFKNGEIKKVIPYTPEDVKNLIEIKEIPVINEVLSEDFDFEQENNFGEIVTRR